MKNLYGQLKNLSDKNLYRLCKRWGAEALHARRKFAGLLPEVNKRRLYERRGFSSIYEFAARLAGMSRDQVDVVLRLEKRFEDKPVLHAALTGGKISANKLARVAAIATAENEKAIAEKIEPLSQKAVEVFVRDFKNANGLQIPFCDAKSLRAQTLKLDEDVERELTEMQERGLDVNEFLRNALQQRRNEIAKMKAEISKEEEAKHEERAMIGFPASRRISVKTIRIVRREWGIKCASPGCGRQAGQIHHERPFAACQSHDPHNLKPLCGGHHELAHTG
jgi:hypothetical protein